MTRCRVAPNAHRSQGRHDYFKFGEPINEVFFVKGDEREAIGLSEPADKEIGQHAVLLSLAHRPSVGLERLTGVVKRLVVVRGKAVYAQLVERGAQRRGRGHANRRFREDHVGDKDHAGGFVTLELGQRGSMARRLMIEKIDKR